MTLEPELSNWDGSSAADIEEIYERYAASTDFVANIVRLIAQKGSQIGATWLLKRHLEAGHRIPQAVANSIFKLLPQQVSWEAKLHLLQCFPYWLMPPESVQTIDSFLHTCLKETNKFVRAWAYHGCYELARQYPEFQPKTRLLLATALQEESASVKARIRNILKQDAKGSQFLTT